MKPKIPACRSWVFLILISLAVPTLHRSARGQDSSTRQQLADLIDNRGGLTDAERLHKLFDVTWEYRMTEFPESATYNGYPGQNDRWTDFSLAAIERRKAERREPLRVIGTIDRSKLSRADRLNYDLFRRNEEEAVEGAQETVVRAYCALRKLKKPKAPWRYWSETNSTDSIAD